MSSDRRLAAALPLLAGLVGLAACASVGSAPRDAFDSAAHLRALYEERLGPYEERPGDAADIPVPFALRGDLLRAAEAELVPRGDDARRVARILEWIFDDVGLEYARHPTRDAAGTFAAAEGNCLSFVNLFVGVGRHLGLAPFYVAVRDLESWDRRDGIVLSQGHVVAGLYLDGELRTFDFLPYRTKSYRHLEPIDDVTAAAHFFNNGGAEALLAGDVGAARTLFERATRLAPRFAEAANNLGVWHLRHGDAGEAERIFRRALEDRPESLPLLTNLARLLRQRHGSTAEAEALLARADAVRHRNPYFFLLRADLALERGDPGAALEALRDALALEPDLPDVHVHLVRAYLALGRVPAARRHLERALELDSRHPEALELARLLGAER